MKRSKQVRKWALLLAVLSLIAASCGSGSDDTKKGTDGSNESSEKPFDGEEISVLGVRGPGEPEGDALVDALKTFTEKTGITVNYDGAGDELATTLSTKVEGGDPPDVALLPQPGLLKDLASKGELQDAEEAIGSDLDKNFKPVWRELGSHEGTLHGVYFKAANKSTVFYRYDSFEELDLTPPTNVEEWAELNQNAADNGAVPIAVGGEDGWTLTDWFENIYVRVAGAEKYQQLTDHEIPWTDDSVKETFKIMESLIGKDEFVADGLSGALLVNFNKSIELALAEENEALMVYEGDFVAGIAKDEVKVLPGTDFDFFPFPAVGDSPASVVGGGDVAVALGDNKAGLELLKFMASAEFAELMIPGGGFTSANQAVSLDTYPDDISKKSAESLVNAEVFVFDMSDSVPAEFGGTPGQGMQGEMQNWLEDPSSIDKVLEELEGQA